MEEKILSELKKGLADLLGERMKAVTLFGSRARGDYDHESDIDVAVIVRDLTRELKNRIFEKVAEIELEHLTPISLLVFSEEEFDRLKRRERRIALDIEREGVRL